MPKAVRKPKNFAPANSKAKSSNRALARKVAALLRRERVDYYRLGDVMKEVRRQLELGRPERAKRLPELLTDADLKALFAVLEDARRVSLRDQVLLHLLLYTGVRVSELVGIRVDQVDLAGRRIFIEQGKGSKDRYVLFKAGFAATLRAYLEGNPENRYLFESNRRGKLTTRRVQQIVREVATAAKIAKRVYPHLLRHQALTFLKRQGLDDAEIQLISGHASRKSLEVYTHLALEDTEPKYQEAMQRSVV